VNDAFARFSVDVEISGNGGSSSGSVFSLFDGEWLESGGSAVDFVVDLSDGVQSSGPGALNGGSSFVCDTNSIIGNSSAGESLDVSEWIQLGIWSNGLHGHCSGVGGPNSISDIDSCNPEVKEGSCWKREDSGGG